jgi:hypothetical protein
VNWRSSSRLVAWKGPLHRHKVAENVTGRWWLAHWHDLQESCDVTVLRSRPDLNPHSPHLRRRPANYSLDERHIGVSPGQRVETMCPRGDLNTGGREISPDRGNHAIGVTRAGRTHPGIPQRVRYLARCLACAGLGGRAGICSRSRARQADPGGSRLPRPMRRSCGRRGKQ